MSDFRGPVGVLLVNVGTPDAPRAPEVRRYLREFLGDPRVLDIHPVARWLLLNLAILPFRPRRSAEAYRSIWSPEGSPLLVHGHRFAKALERRLGEGYAVVLAMRYGSPSIGAGLREIRERGSTRVIAFPLYPQHASSTAGSALEEVFRQAGSFWNMPSIACVPPFFDDGGFIEAIRQSGSESLRESAADHVLFSFHGLPERHILKTDAGRRHCLRSPDCCATISSRNRFCYRAQCFETARLAAAALGTPAESWSVAFQSRLGRDSWVGPPTDRTVVGLAKRGVRRLAVFCPSFVADCLETIEEIGIRARKEFLSAGGEDLRLVPSVNDTAGWVEAAAAMVRRASSSFA